MTNDDVLRDKISKSIKNNNGELYLGYEMINEFPLLLIEYNELKKIDLSGNQIKCVPENIGEMKFLEEIILDNNIIEIIPETIGKMRNIKKISMRNNKIKKLPDEISNLSNIEEMDFRNNLIEKLPFDLRKLTKIKKMYLRDNKIVKIEKTLPFIKSLEELWIRDNPIENIPQEIINKDLDDIRNYFNKINEKSKELYEAKLMFVGEGEVGKTSIIKKLLDNEIDISKKANEITEGMDIYRQEIQTEEIDKFRINIWDFGGQEIYYSTHQFFITKNSLYVFVWNARNMTKTYQSLYYWLNIIKHLANNAPVIIVMNKADKFSDELPTDKIEKDFPEINKQYLKVSAYNGFGIMELSIKIRDSIKKLNHIGRLWPVEFSNVRDILENLREKNDFITYKYFLKICQENRLNENEAETLIEFLHDLGILLHYGDDGSSLKNIVILNLEWGTNGVYQLLSDSKIKENRGRFTFEDIKRILNKPNYVDKWEEIICLMNKFELSFQFHESKDYIIPALMPKKRPLFEWNYKENIRFEYKYDFMPTGIISRLIVRLHKIIDKDSFWSDGVVFKIESNTKALVMSDSDDRKIKIWITGRKNKELLTLIMKDMKIIHKSLNDLKPKEMIPCICQECQCRNIKDSEPNFYEYEILKNRVKYKKYEIYCDKGQVDVSIDKLIGGVFSKEKVEEIKKHRNIEIGEDGKNFLIAYIVPFILILILLYLKLKTNIDDKYLFMAFFCILIWAPVQYLFMTGKLTQHNFMKIAKIFSQLFKG